MAAAKARARAALTTAERAVVARVATGCAPLTGTECRPAAAREVGAHPRTAVMIIIVVVAGGRRRRAIAQAICVRVDEGAVPATGATAMSMTGTVVEVVVVVVVVVEEEEDDVRR
jgi:hypothetical protein